MFIGPLSDRLPIWSWWVLGLHFGLGCLGTDRLG